MERSGLGERVGASLLPTNKPGRNGISLETVTELNASPCPELDGERGEGSPPPWPITREAHPAEKRHQGARGGPPAPPSLHYDNTEGQAAGWWGHRPGPRPWASLRSSPRPQAPGDPRHRDKHAHTCTHTERPVQSPWGAGEGGDARGDEVGGGGGTQVQQPESNEADREHQPHPAPKPRGGGGGSGEEATP